MITGGERTIRACAYQQCRLAHNDTSHLQHSAGEDRWVIKEGGLAAYSTPCASSKTLLGTLPKCEKFTYYQGSMQLKWHCTDGTDYDWILISAPSVLGAGVDAWIPSGNSVGQSTPFVSDGPCA